MSHTPFSTIFTNAAILVGLNANDDDILLRKHINTHTIIIDYDFFCIG